MEIFDDSIFRSERCLEGLERVLEAWGGRRQGVPTNICQRILGVQNGGPRNLVSKIGVLVREHEIQKSIWRYYTSEKRSSTYANR